MRGVINSVGASKGGKTMLKKPEAAHAVHTLALTAVFSGWLAFAGLISLGLYYFVLGLVLSMGLYALDHVEPKNDLR